MNTLKSLTVVALGTFMFSACSSAKSNDSINETMNETADNHASAAKTTTISGKTSIVWNGTKVIGGGHTGTLEAKETTLELNGDALTGGRVVVDMTTLTNSDQDGEWKQQLEDHLTSDDFFAVAQYPTATMTLTSVSNGANGVYNANGDLTIKGMTLAQQFVIKEVKNGKSSTFTVHLEFDRTQYGIKYGSNNFFDDLKDKAIGDIVTIDVEIVANK